MTAIFRLSGKDQLLSLVLMVEVMATVVVGLGVVHTEPTGRVVLVW